MRHIIHIIVAVLLLSVATTAAVSGRGQQQLAVKAQMAQSADTSANGGNPPTAKPQRARRAVTPVEAVPVTAKAEAQPATATVATTDTAVASQAVTVSDTTATVSDTAAAVGDTAAVTSDSVGTATRKSRRTITPVEQTTNVTLLARKGEKYIERDSLVLDSLRQDSIRKIYPKYPLLTDITIGFNFWDGIAKIFGQGYGGFDFSVQANMWNRVAPVFEFGLGRATSTPDGLNYTYRSGFSPYFKLGANYNLMFKKVPDYQFFVGARVAYSTFKYDITDVTLADGYWGEQEPLSITGQSSHAMWAEIMLGLKVKLWGPVSAGWAFKFHKLFSYKKNPSGEPWYIPGFGTRTSKLAVSLSVYYTLPQMKHKWPKLDEQGKLVRDTEPMPMPAHDTQGNAVAPGTAATDSVLVVGK